MTAILSEAPQPHPARARAIRAAHPEVKALMGRDPWTAPLLLGLAGAQLALGVACAFAPAWVTLVGAWCVGAFLSHALYAGLHELSHQLVFRSRAANRWLALVLNLPLGAPFAISYMHYHLQHHLRQGDYERDPDLPSARELRLLSRSWLGKLVWHALLPALAALRSRRLPPPPARVSAWIALNVGLQLAFVAASVVLLGWLPLLYFALSFWFTLSLHPLAGRFLQEHHLVSPEQETYDYLGPLNRIALNVGYHNEHHDFPGVPWSRLPALRALAPEAYEGLRSHRSWTRLWLRFLADPELGYQSRVYRGAPPSLRAALGAEPGPPSAAPLPRETCAPAQR